MKQAMDRDDLSTVLERASGMIGELGDSSSGLLTPKNYYELHMRALDDMPNIEEYFLSLMAGTSAKLDPESLYAYVQYSPRVLTRLYLQISAGSVYIKMEPEKTEWVLKDLAEAVKSVQNPVRGLFLRHFLLQATRDKLPDNDKVDVAIEFVMKNFLEMNKLWVRIQSLPGDGKSKERRKRRERERNELRILVGTNLVRLSQLESVTSQKYGETILPRILEQVVECGDPLAQAYLIDCLVQVFPDEYHIETLAILLAVCPKLRDKVNVRTIIQSLMDRLSNYYADEELLDEADTNDVKKSMFNDSFPLFENCVQQVFNARGPKLASKEVIRLQTALLNFSLKFDKSDNDRFARCLQVTVDFVKQAESGAFSSDGYLTGANRQITLNDAAVAELQKMLSIPLDLLGLNVLRIPAYSSLLELLPAQYKYEVGLSMLRAMDKSAGFPSTVQDVRTLFAIVAPAPGSLADAEHTGLLSKLVLFIGQNKDQQVAMEMLTVARQHLSYNGTPIVVPPLVSVTVSALSLLSSEETAEEKQDEEKETETPDTTNGNGPEEKKEKEGNGEEGNGADGPADKPEEGNGEETKKDVKTSEQSVDESASPTEPSSTGSGAADPETESPAPAEEPSVVEEAPPPVPASAVKPPEVPAKADPRVVFRFAQETVAMLEQSQTELAIKLYLEICTAANVLAKDAEGDDAVVSRQVATELIERGMLLTDKDTSVGVQKSRCIVAVVGTLLGLDCISSKDYERMVTKVAQCAARLPHKTDQCTMISLCSHLFFNVASEVSGSDRMGLDSTHDLFLGYRTQCTSKRTDECLSHDSRSFLFFCLHGHSTKTRRGHSSVSSVASSWPMPSIRQTHPTETCSLICWRTTCTSLRTKTPLFPRLSLTA